MLHVRFEIGKDQNFVPQNMLITDLGVHLDKPLTFEHTFTRSEEIHQYALN